MYEKPQYLTPDGYKRTGKNPFKSGIPFKEAVQRLASNENSDPVLNKDIPNKKVFDSTKIKPHIAQFLKSKQNLDIKQSGISDNAARLIAMAIKGLLKNN
jgi:hypothetical protein